MFYPSLSHVRAVQGQKGVHCNKVIVELVNGSQYVIDWPSSEAGMIDYMDFTLDQLRKGNTICVKEEDIIENPSVDIEYVIQEDDND